MLLGRYSIRKLTTPSCIGEAKITHSDDVHANNNIIVLEIALHHFKIGDDIASRNGNMC